MHLNNSIKRLRALELKEGEDTAMVVQELGNPVEERALKGQAERKG